MASFTVFILTLIVLSAAAATATSAYRATATSAYRATTTTTVEITNPGESERCSPQIGIQRLRSCQRYLRSSSKFESIMPENDGAWREEFPKCCDELEQINKECICEAIKQVIQGQRQGERLQEREMREMLQTAKSLPSLCRISSQYCENIPGGSGSVF